MAFGQIRWLPYCLLSLILLVITGPELVSAQSSPTGRVTPLQAAGMTPLWQEDFSDGSLDRLQYSWAKGDNQALRSFVMPGAVYLGHENASGWPWNEQQLNNFRTYQAEPLPQTLEFDIFSPILGDSRIALRPRRLGDFAKIRLGMLDNKSVIDFVAIDQPSYQVVYNEPTGPAYGWAHVTVSYRQFDLAGTIYMHYVVAINNEVRELQAPSGITNPDWLTYWQTRADADGWSIEYNTRSDPTMGRYLANVRAYSGFLSKEEMDHKLKNRVEVYRTALPDPTNYNGPVQYFQSHKTLLTRGPNASLYARQTEPLTLKLDASLSSDWNRITAYQWTFGDGNGGSGRTVYHTYQNPGSYEVTLAVTSKTGTDTHRLSVFVDGGLKFSAGQTLAALPGAQLLVEHTLTNHGKQSMGLDLLATPSVPGWSALVAPSTIKPLAPRASATVAVLIQVSEEALANLSGLIKLSALSQTDGTEQSAVTDTVIVEALYQSRLSPPQFKYVKAGKSLELVHSLTNSGNIEDSFNLAATIDQPDWSAIISPVKTKKLAPGESVELKITVQIPAGAPADLQGIVEITAESRSDHSAKSVVSDILIVEVRHSAITPANLFGGATPGGLVEFAYTVTNMGNLPDGFNLTIASYPPGWKVQLLPDQVGPLAPMAQQTGLLRVELPAEAVVGTINQLDLLASSWEDDEAQTRLTYQVEVQPFKLFLPQITRP